MELNWNFQRGGEGGGGGGNSNQKAFCRRGINIFWNITLHLAGALLNTGTERNDRNEPE